MYNISETASVLPSGSRSEQYYYHNSNSSINYHHNNNNNSETSYLPSHLIVSSSSSTQKKQKKTSTSTTTTKQETNQGRQYRQKNRLSQKIASVSVLLTSKLLRRHKRLGTSTSTTTNSTNTNTNTNSTSSSSSSQAYPEPLQEPQDQEQLDIFDTFDNNNKNNNNNNNKNDVINSSSSPQRTSLFTFQPLSSFGSANHHPPTEQNKNKNKNNKMNPTAMLIKSAIPGGGGFLNFKGEEKDGVVTKVAPLWVYFFGAATITVTVLTNLAFEEWFIYTCTGMTAVFAPYVVYQKTKIAELGSFRENYNVLRNLTNKFHNENNRLSSNIDDLEAQNDALVHIKDDLKELAEDNTNLDRLVTVVKELQEINAEIKENLNAKIVQDIIKTVLSCDRDGDLKLSKKEMMKLNLRLVYSPGFTFHEAQFKKVLGKPLDGKNYDISRILNLIRNINDKSIPKEEAIFTMKPVSELKSF